MKIINNYRTLNLGIFLAFSLFIFVPVACSSDNDTVKTDTGQKQIVPKAGNKIIVKPGDQPAPKITFSEVSHDFGTITQGEKVTHTFKVINTGDAPLRLIRAKGS